MLTETDLLGMLDARYSPKPKPGYPQRYLIGHHVSPPISFAAREHVRVADAIVLDRNTSFQQRTTPDKWGRLGNDYATPYMAVHGFEVKVSRSDWLRELKDPCKSEAWSRYCHHWWLVAPRDVVKPGELPENWGHLAPAGRGLRRVTDAPLRNVEDMPSPVVVAMSLAILKHERKR